MEAVQTGLLSVQNDSQTVMVQCNGGTIRLTIEQAIELRDGTALNTAIFMASKIRLYQEDIRQKIKKLEAEIVVLKGETK